MTIYDAGPLAAGPLCGLLKQLPSLKHTCYSTDLPVHAFPRISGAQKSPCLFPPSGTSLLFTKEASRVQSACLERAKRKGNAPLELHENTLKIPEIHVFRYFFPMPFVGMPFSGVEMEGGFQQGPFLLAKMGILFYKRLFSSGT